MQDERIERIRQMEQYYDALLAAGDEISPGAQAEEMLLKLREYYSGGLWLSDYEADERGELPKELKRGVLSQDGLHDLLVYTEKKRCSFA